jgi:tetratricopeptide (TPR) repeat protein
MVAKQMMRAAAGWLELGMPGDALGELEGLSHDEGRSRKALELKLAAQMAMSAWVDASVTGLDLCGIAPEDPDYHLSAAYCLHETGATERAMDCLLNGPEALKDFPLYHYNMACYLWTLGDGDTAKRHLLNAVEMDEGFLEAARTDRDLVGMEF